MAKKIQIPQPKIKPADKGSGRDRPKPVKAMEIPPKTTTGSNKKK